LGFFASADALTFFLHPIVVCALKIFLDTGNYTLEFAHLLNLYFYKLGALHREFTTVTVISENKYLKKY